MNQNERMPKRVTVTLADTVADKLQRWADARGQPIATVAGIAIELAINTAEDRGDIPSQPTPSDRG